MPLIQSIETAREDLAAIGAAASRLRAGANDIVILGTGGSSLEEGKVLAKRYLAGGG